MTHVNNRGDSEYKFVIEDNERCFLPNNDKINYDSVILLELFQIENFNDLFDGLDRLYINLNSYDKLSLCYRQIVPEDNENQFRGTLYLPCIVNTKFKGRPLSRVVFQDMDNSINHISINLKATLPSLITLQIQASLDTSVSKSVNDIIYTYHGVNEQNNSSDYEFPHNDLPSQIKNKQIKDIKNHLKNEVIKFLSAYFEGEFFKEAKKHISHVPSIDLFSLSYPDKLDDISKWFDDCRFFYCFDILAFQKTTYKCENYIFILNSSSDEKDVFPNHSIIANLKTTNKNGYATVKGSIQYPLNSCSFELLSYYRWLEMKRRVGTSFNLLVSKEREYIDNNDLSKVISNRELIAEYFFQFERFKIEITGIAAVYVKCNYKFKSLGDGNLCLFDAIMEQINVNLDYMEKFITTLNRHSDSTLALKNIEYTKKMQDLVLFLTLVVIIISVAQMILDNFDSKNIITYLINYLINYLF